MLIQIHTSSFHERVCLLLMGHDLMAIQLILLGGNDMLLVIDDGFHDDLIGR